MAVNRELGFLTELLVSGNMSTVVDNCINTSYLTGRYKKAFRFIQEHQSNYGKIPTIETFLEKNKGINLVEHNGEIGTGENIKYWCDELRTKKKHNTMADSLESVMELMNEDVDTEGAYDFLKKLVLNVESQIIQSDRIKLSDSEIRWEDYKKRQRSGGITGIPTGIDMFDKITGGLNKGELTTLMAYTGVGKANPLSTPVLTPKGFVPMGEIKVGSTVIGEDGKPYNVTKIFPQGVKDVFELTFSDGTKSKCCKEHLWKFKTLDDFSRDNDWRVDSLENIIAKYKMKKGRGYNLCIPVNKAVEYERRGELSIDPYVMGALLGDGGFTTDRITLTNSENDIINKCNESLKLWGRFTHHKGTDSQYNFKSLDPKCNKLYRAITDLGLKHKKSGEKFIPEQYLFASIEDRLNLLKGIFDTDGHVDVKGGLSVSTTSPQLVHDIEFLARSLGYRTLVAKSNREGKSTEFKITISTKDIIFSSKKHMQRFDSREKPNKNHRYDILKIVDIQQVESEECQCISVDSKDHTYIVDDFIVTHNTWWEVIVAVALAKAGYRVLFITTEMSTKALYRRIDAVWNSLNYTRFRRGQLMPDEEKRFSKYIEEMKEIEEEDELLTVEQATGGISQISAKIDQYNPDVILIDGGYLLEDEEGDEDNWMGMVRIWRGLHRLCLLKDKPIVVSTQSKDEEGATLKSVNFAKAIAQDCLPKDTLLLTPTGYIPIQDTVGKKIKVFDGTNVKLAVGFESGLKDELELKYRGKSFVCSPNHIVKVYDNLVGSFEWKKACEISPKTDFLLEYNVDGIEFGGDLIDISIPTRGNKVIKIPTRATEKLGRFIGYMIGDGSLRPYERGQVTLSCGYDEEFALEAIQLAQELFDIEGDIKREQTKHSKGKQLKVVWYSRAFSDVLLSIIEPNNEKSIRKDLLTLNKDFRLGLLAGLIESDGGIGRGLKFHMKPKALIDNIALLCSSLGVSNTKQTYSNSVECICRSKDLLKLDLKLGTIKTKQFLKLSNIENDKYIKPKLFIKNLVAEFMSKGLTKGLDRSIQNRVYYAKTHLQASESLIDMMLELLGKPKLNFRFAEVQSLDYTGNKVPMYDVTVIDSDDKTIVTDAVVTHNCDVFCVLEQDEQEKNDREATIRFLKLREGEILSRIKMNWDFDKMDYSCIYQENSVEETQVDNVQGVITIE